MKTPAAREAVVLQEPGTTAVQGRHLRGEEPVPLRLYYAGVNRKTLYARTRGITDFDAVRRLQFDGPVHPQVALSAWRPHDRRRRRL